MANDVYDSGAETVALDTRGIRQPVRVQRKTREGAAGGRRSCVG
jgi:hypothetical protein